MAGSERKAAGTTRVWFVRLPADEGVVAAHRRLLDDEERGRADRLHRPADRARFVAAHAARRVLLGDALGRDPAALAFGCDPCPLCADLHGRPHVVGSDRPISLSRTTGLAAFALAPAGLTVGVDVEATDGPVGLEDLTAALHRDEAAAVNGLAPPDRRAAALRVWVRKEAYLKGTGTGLGVDPATVAVDRTGWTVTDLDAGTAHLAAVAHDTTAPVAVDVTMVDIAMLL